MKNRLIEFLAFLLRLRPVFRLESARQLPSNPIAPLSSDCQIESLPDGLKVIRHASGTALLLQGCSADRMAL